jgi:hypothetical protein
VLPTPWALAAVAPPPRNLPGTQPINLGFTDSVTIGPSDVVPADAVWVVPATALIARAAGPQVVTVRGDGTVHYMGVDLGRDLGQSVEIASGLTGQERLVVSPPDGLKEGARVAAGETR